MRQCPGPWAQQQLGGRRGSELGKRERRKRRLGDDADEDDLGSLDEPLPPAEPGKKRRRAGTRAALPACAHAQSSAATAVLFALPCPHYSAWTARRASS
jgi:hypothetical protein